MTDDIRIQGLQVIIRLNELFGLLQISLEEILTISALEISRLFSADRCLIYKVEDDQLLLATYQLNISEYRTPHIHKSDYLKDCKVCVSKVPCIYDSQNACPNRIVDNENIPLYICVPIEVEEKIFGVSLVDFLKRKAISNNELNLLIAIANLLGLTIHRCLLFKKLSEEKARLESAFLEIKSLNEELNKKFEELKEMQEQLLQSQKLEAIGRLAGGIAHDFNNILVAIIGYAELLERGVRENNVYKEYAKRIIDASEKAKALTQKILAFSRKQMIEVQRLNPNTLITHIIEMLDKLLPENIEVRLALSETICCVDADRHQIEQVIMNVVINARDAMPEGGTILIQTDTVNLDKHKAKELQVEDGKYAMLAISDTGKGMSEEVLKHIFEPFFTTKAPGEGTGLGLSVVYGIIKQHKGTIEVESKEGVGSTFRIYLPCAKLDEAKNESVKESIEIPKGRKERILVVEDNEIVRSLLEAVLSELDYTITVLSDAEDALRLINSGEKFDLVITDIVMPGMNGTELVQKIREVMDVKVLFISGYSENIIKHHGLKKEEILLKPFNQKTLATKVRALLDERKQELV